jgi:hypothetical protein
LRCCFALKFVCLYIQNISYKLVDFCAKVVDKRRNRLISSLYTRLNQAVHGSPTNTTAVVTISQSRTNYKKGPTDLTFHAPNNILISPPREPHDEHSNHATTANGCSVKRAHETLEQRQELGLTGRFQARCEKDGVLFRCIICSLEGLGWLRCPARDAARTALRQALGLKDGS